MSPGVTKTVIAIPGMNPHETTRMDAKAKQKKYSASVFGVLDDVCN